MLPAACILTAAAGASPAIAASRTLAVSGVPPQIGRGQSFLVAASGTVPPNLLFGGGKLSIVIAAVDTVTTPHGYCPTDRYRILLARTIDQEQFSFTAHARIRSDLDFHLHHSYRFRICAALFPNALRVGQNDTEATAVDLDAASTQVFGGHMDNPLRPVTGQITQPDGTGLPAVSVAAPGAGRVFTGPDGRYTMLVGKRPTVLTPSLPGITFAPGSRTVRSPATKVNFVGAPAAAPLLAP
jgi:hypothetical protein